MFREAGLHHLPETFLVRPPNHHENQNQLVTKAQKGGWLCLGKFLSEVSKEGGQQLLLLLAVARRMV